MNAVFPHHAYRDANPVRTPDPATPSRTVQIRYTGFAQVACRYHTLFAPDPAHVVRELLRQLGANPEELRVRAMQLGDVAVLRRMPAIAEAHLKPGTIQPVAFVDGLSETELAAALARHGRLQ